MRFSKYNNPNRRKRRHYVDPYEMSMRKRYTDQYFEALAKAKTKEEIDKIESAYNLAMASTGTPRIF